MSLTLLFRELLNRTPKLWSSTLFILMILVGITDGVGFLLLVPILEAIGTGGSIPVVFLRVIESTGLHKLFGTISAILLAFLILILIRGLLQYSRDYLAVLIQNKITDDMRELCLKGLLQVEWSWIVAKQKSDYSSLLVTDISRVGVAINFFLNMMATLCMVVACVFTAVIMSPVMAMIVLIGGGFMFLFTSLHRSSTIAMGNDLGLANRVFHSHLQQSLTEVKLAKIIGSMQSYADNFSVVLKNLRNKQLSFSANIFASKFFFQVGGAVVLCAYLYLGLEVWSTPIPELLTLIFLFARVSPLLMTVHQYYAQCLHCLPALAEVNSLLNDCEKMSEPKVRCFQGKIDFKEKLIIENVTVVYEGRSKPALNNISLSIIAGTTTAIIGNSGSGKSTLADVLMGLLAPNVGVMSVDGVDISGKERINWRRSIAYVPQEIIFRNDSIRNNILWGHPEFSQDDLDRVLKLTDSGFIYNLPEGLDTNIGDAGVRLSGGERQKIAIARALLGEPKMLVLDEATSAMDKNSEIKIRDTINKLSGHLTLVVIGHRLSMVESADQVIILKDGNVLKVANWEESSFYLASVT